MARDIKILNTTSFSSECDGYPVDISIGSKPRSMSGLELLSHKWVTIFLSEPLSSPVDPDSGGGVLQEIGQNSDIKTLTDFRAKCQLASEKTTNEILISQIEERIEDEQELLNTAVITSVTKDADDSFNVAVQLINEARVGTNLLIPMIS